ncbi:MAG: serine/threonine protein kinase [Pirellulales bacterium]
MWNQLLRWLGRGRSADIAGQAHMTFGQTSIGRTVSRTGVLLKKQLWIWPVAAVLLLGGIGYFVTNSIHHTMETNLRAQLESLLHVERAMVEKWLAGQEANALTLANDQHVRRLVVQLLAAEQRALAVAEAGGTVAPAAAAGAGDGTLPSVNELRESLGKEMAPGLSAHRFLGFVVTDKDHRVLATNHAELLGQSVPQFADFLNPVLEGDTLVSPPFRSISVVKDDNGRLQTGVPTMFASAPVRDETLQIVAVLSLRIRPDREFTRLVQLGQIGESGETYAFDKSGLMVSGSRFEEQLILLGLVPDEEGASSLLTVQLRDPGGDLTRGYRPTVRRSELPLTRMAASATDGHSQTDVNGYADYRGVPVVGTWTWLPKYQLGLATELDYDEAFRPLTILQRTFHVLFTLLVLAASAIFVFTLVVARLQREARKAAVEARHLGQYRLEERIGEGAMGVVYRGCHAMLRRPTAIKLLNVERVNEASIRRFEHEVQMTCQLNNPHTVAIYDYGRTPEGVFYYAMEYLDGIDLQQLVERYGAQPEGRVVPILKQICSSLYEAHSLGLVHRDIKPANVMLNRRGGEPDVIKVLDFGLVKAMDEGKHVQPTSGMAGTPLYMSPEAIQTPDLVDARSDLYAVGAVGYFLLTGRPVFQANSLAQLCQQHLDSVPTPPSEMLGRTVSPELEHALLACLEKNRARRPQTARDLSELLERVPATRWTLSEADAWWSRHERQRGTAASVASGGAERESATAPNATLTTPNFDQTLAHDASGPGDGSDRS